MAETGTFEAEFVDVHSDPVGPTVDPSDGLWMVLQVTRKGSVVGKPRVVRGPNADAARDAAFPAAPNHEAVVQCSVFRLYDPYRHVAYDVLPQSAKWGRSRAFDGKL